MKSKFRMTIIVKSWPMKFVMWHYGRILVYLKKFGLTKVIEIAIFLNLIC
jgi:hypothetical protein